ncbi:MAG: class I SAM-dependent methyltransferase [Actinobacteria bacterium]|nr:class I SAM-dependent methyltransferase [Actinomycetota bacterium]
MGFEHYGRVEDPVTAILTGIGRSHDLTIDDLAPVDEFHLGGASATAALVADLDLRPEDRVLDIGSGIGGPARRIASVVGCEVVGVDLTPSFVETAIALSELTGLADRTSFVVGDATRLEFSSRFDAATLVHVGMNIPDKPAFFAAVADRLEPGARLGIYDLMATGDPDGLSYPLPFASDASEAWVASPDAYVAALVAAPPVSLATLMGPDFDAMFTNIGAALRGGLLAPVQIIATR